MATVIRSCRNMERSRRSLRLCAAPETGCSLRSILSQVTHKRRVCTLESDAWWWWWWWWWWWCVCGGEEGEGDGEGRGKGRVRVCCGGEEEERGERKGRGWGGGWCLCGEGGRGFSSTREEGRYAVGGGGGGTECAITKTCLTMSTLHANFLKGQCQCPGRFGWTDQPEKDPTPIPSEGRFWASAVQTSSNPKARKKIARLARLNPPILRRKGVRRNLFHLLGVGCPGSGKL